MQYLIVKNSVVVQVIEWDGETPYAFPEGVTYEANDYAGIGWIFDPEQNKYINPRDGIEDEENLIPVDLPETP